MIARRLIVSGDDFGAGPETNAGIVRAHADGILTSASLMVTGAAADEAVDLARAHPELAVGLHLVLAQGTAASPPSAIPQLARPDGRFGDGPVSCGIRYAALWVTERGRAALRREVTAQLEAFRRTGLPLAHVDGHCNMHLHPMVLPLLIELAEDYEIRAIRVAGDPLGRALRWDRRHAARKTAEATIFRVLDRRARSRLSDAGIACVDRVVGMHQTGAIDEAYVLDLIANLPDGTTELYCHPALGTAAATAPFQRGYRNADEVGALTSARVRAALDAAGITLARYPDLTSARR